MKEAIIAAVLKIKGVTRVDYVQNTTMSFCYNTMLPPYSFRVSVQGGKKKEIAQAIWSNKCMGACSVGDKSVKVSSPVGYWYIRFQRIPK